MIDLAHALNEVLNENGYAFEIKRRLAPAWSIKFLAFFSRDLAGLAPMVDQPVKTMVNTRSRELLGIEYKRTIKELMLESAESMMKSGAVPTKRHQSK